MSIRKRILWILSAFANFNLVRWLVVKVDFFIILLGKSWGFFRSRALLTLPYASNCHWSVEVKYGKNINVLGAVVIGPNCTLGAKSQITLEKGVRLSKGVVLETASLDLSAKHPYPHISKPIYIEEGVWLGANVMVLGGVRIGRYAVVGAGTVVTRDIAQDTVVVGMGSRLIEKRNAY